MKHIIIIIFLSVGLFGLITSVRADSVKNDAINQLKTGAEYAGYGNNAQDPRIIVSRIIQMFLGFMGTVFTYLFVYSGYHMITSHGEEEKITKARKTMQGAFIGLMLTLMAFSITYFVGRKLTDITGVSYNSSYTDQNYI